MYIYKNMHKQHACHRVTEVAVDDHWCIHVYTTHAHIHTYSRIHDIHAHVLYINIHTSHIHDIHAHTHTYMHTHIFTYTWYTHTNTGICTHSRTHTHIYMRAITERRRSPSATAYTTSPCIHTTTCQCIPTSWALTTIIIIIIIMDRAMGDAHFMSIPSSRLFVFVHVFIDVMSMADLVPEQRQFYVSSLWMFSCAVEPCMCICGCIYVLWTTHWLRLLSTELRFWRPQ